MEKKFKISNKTVSTVVLSLSYAIMIVLAFTMIFPYLYMVLTTFKPMGETVSPELKVFPIVWTAESYKEIWQLVPFGRGILNTMTVEVPVILVGTFTSALGAYAFAKMRMPCSKIILLVLMSSMMVPFAALFLPQYQIYSSLGLTNNLLPLILPGLFGNISMVFFFIQFMGGIPTALLEAAKIDGCGHFKSFLHIMLPLLWPAMAAQAVFWFLGIWNDYFAPSIYLTKEEVMTLQPLINRLNATQGGRDLPLVMTGAFLSSIPLIAVYLAFQKYFMSALSITSGIK
ncbi:MAG: carbohydrate ABC transporter permease [Clostridia bacterium]|nr:carbohydrate ABC transporter permease [Clostridia bacterium]